MKRLLYYLSPLIIILCVYGGYRIYNAILSDEKKILRIVVQTSEAIKERDAGGVIKHLSFTYTDRCTGADAGTVKQFFMHLFRTNVAFDLSYNQKYLTLKGDSATGAFEISFTAPNGDPVFNWVDYYPRSRLCVLFIKERGKWIIQATDKNDFFERE